MINNKPIIKWQKWIDPFGLEHEDAKWTDYDNKIETIESIKTKIKTPDEHYDLEENPYEEKQTTNNPIKVIASPMGLIPYNEHTASSKIFNFWVGHTNFSISKAIVSIIENSDGVEILDIFTRYRFRIAIGKCFNDSSTMTNINGNITKYFNNEHQRSQL
jgi:hypothetical protein